jgi:hypothetical protein
MTLHPEEVLDPKQPALVVTYGLTARKYRPLQRDLVVIGQGRGSDIGLTGPDIADAHCVLFRTAAGWRVRDCGSRIGTRLNGKSVQEAELCDGDVLQVGTFNFRVYLPPLGPAADVSTRERRLQRCRYRLVHLALALRRRLGRQPPQEAPAGLTQAEVDQQLAMLRERVRHYEARLQQLQKEERELTTDRGWLEGEWAALRLRAQQAERAATERRAAVEAELRRRQEECEQRCRELERRAAAASPAAGDPAEARRLDLRRRELDCYAHHLRRLQQRSGSDGRALAAEVEQLRAALAAARREAEEKEAQVQRLLTERPLLDPSAEGMDVESYEAELAEFRRQLQDDRRGVNEEIRALRERTAELDEAARAMEQQLSKECERLAAERAELDLLRGETGQQRRPGASGSRERLEVIHRFQETMAALTRWQQGQPRPAGGDKGGSNGRGYRLRAPRRGDGSSSAGR